MKNFSKYYFQITKKLDILTPCIIEILFMHLDSMQKAIQWKKIFDDLFYYQLNYLFAV